MLQTLKMGQMPLDDIPASTKHLYNVCTMSAQRLRRLSNIVQNDDAIQMFLCPLGWQTAQIYFFHTNADWRINPVKPIYFLLVSLTLS